MDKLGQFAASWLAAVARGFRWVVSGARVAVGLALVAALVVLGAAVAAIVVTNGVFSVPYNVAFRALDPDSPPCQTQDGWNILADVGNNEELAVEQGRLRGEGGAWEMRLRCSIQTHVIPGYQPLDSQGAPIGQPSELRYDLAFVEFQENGDPYLLCSEDEYRKGFCNVSASAPGGDDLEYRRGQLEALLERLGARPMKMSEKQDIKPPPPSTKNFVIAFVHGWRDTADIGDGAVADLRVYAAHAARFVADRCTQGDQRFCGMKVTAVFIGWRGARTDEGRIRRLFAGAAAPFCGQETCWLKELGGDLGTFAAAFTLFDRKPVSEAIAPSVIAALRAIESQIGLQSALRPEDLAPCDHSAGLAELPPVCDAEATDGAKRQARMVVFGHSLGGNVLATGLQDETLKLVDRHAPGDFLPSPLGNLVVLLNPASEAAKWTAIQRAVWRRTAMSNADKAKSDDVDAGFGFFRDEQRPVLISVTSARDWPPDGVWATDCADLSFLENHLDKDTKPALDAFIQEGKRRARSIDYDWATYDLFPAFQFDFRPLASSLERYAQRRAASGGESSGQGARSDADYLFEGCAAHSPSSAAGWLAHWASSALRVFPFMNTDVEKSHTIGHLDPPRSPVSLMRDEGISARPFGTTHQLVGWDPNAPAAARPRAARALKRTESGAGDAPAACKQGDSNCQEATLPYAEIGSRKAYCPPARGWLSKARAFRTKEARDSHGVGWDASDVVHGSQPALRFEHGFYPAHLPAITRANDPFWNIRALDDALAEHDGYMLSSFICAMQQLVLDDITDIPPLRAVAPKPLAAR